MNAQDLLQIKEIIREVIREELTYSSAPTSLAEPSSLRQRVLRDAENHSRQLREKRERRNQK